MTGEREEVFVERHGVRYEVSRMLAYLAERKVDLSPHSDDCDIIISGNCDCAVTAMERELQEARVQRTYALMRNHTKQQLLRMAFAGGLVDFNSPAKWSKQELASTVADQQLPRKAG